MKRFMLYALTGMSVCLLLSTWLGPKMIGWWFQPPVAVPVDCTNALQWAMHRLVVMQGAGVAAGFVFGCIAAVVFRRGQPS